MRACDCVFILDQSRPEKSQLGMYMSASERTQPPAKAFALQSQKAREKEHCLRSDP